MNSEPTNRLLLARTFVLGVLLLSAVGGPAHRVEAQDFSSTLPDAISDRELQRVEKRLRLTSDQVFAVERFYGAYKTSFAALARQEIAAFGADVARHEATGFPEPHDAERLHRKALRIREKIAALDEQFFAEVEAVLTDEQLAIVPRVRSARDRHRYRSSASMLGSEAVVDLSEVIESIRLSGDQRAAIDPTLQRYEDVLTRQMRKIHEANVTGFLEVLEARAATAEGVHERPLVETVAEVEKRVRTLVVQTRDGNRQACRQVCELLSPDSGQLVRRAYYGRAYLEIAVLSGGLGDEFAQARSFADLDAELRASVAELEYAYRSRLNGLIEKIADQVDRTVAAHSPFRFNPSRWEEHERQIATLQRETVSAHLDAVDGLAEVLGPDLADRLDRADGRHFLDLWQAGDEEDWTEEDPAWYAAEAEPGERLDPYVAAAITRRDIAGYAQRLDLADEQKFILRCLYTEYRQKMRALEPQLIDPILELDDRLWGVGIDDREAPVDVDTVNRLYQLRAAARDRLQALEKEFFEDLWLVLRDDQVTSLAHVRRSRDRQAHAREPYPDYLAGSMREVSVDLLRLLEDQGVDQAGLDPLRKDLEEYETEVTKAFREEHEAGYQLHWALQEWEVVRRPLSRETPGIEEIARPHVERISARHDRLSTVRRSIQEMNEALVDRVAGGLDDDAARSLRKAFRRATWAEVYDDPDSATRPLQRAVELDDLTPRQHGQVGGLRREYDDAYARLCREMIDIAREDPGFPIGNRPDVWQKLDAREEALQQRLNERDELNERTRRRLALVLTADQIARIGGLDPADTD